MHKTIGVVIAADLTRRFGAKTPAAYRTFGSHITALLGDARLTRFGEGHLVAYAERRRERGAADSTILRELRHLRAALRRAGYDCPAFPTGLADTERTTTIGKGEAKRLLDALREASPYAADIVLLLVGTAARKGEIFSADWPWIEEVDGQVVIAVPSSGAKEREAKRLCPTNGAADAARRLIAARAERPFGRPGSTPVADYHHVRRAVRSACSALGLPDVHLHDLRRSVASWLFRDGERLERVAHLLGHRSLETTRRWYAHLDDAARREMTSAATSGFD